MNVKKDQTKEKGLQALRELERLREILKRREAPLERLFSMISVKRLNTLFMRRVLTSRKKRRVRG